ncbi:Hachiman antiphage defense system protein HamA [uncultured Chryseobacterium sp.]|uniref:Hachiman antiphage defense system protein HamA n=1 Tax=uncultured Chryseobacterium sp. TaxID=259322 RepID=UPI0025D70904|nr:Hachiman antiphage defense system protein HamA [uncultured Chryseobacterium sp.]
MAINGIRTIQNRKYFIFFIENFSDELKQLIRDQLQGIFHGFSEYESLEEFYSYQNTLKSFLERYNSKYDDAKKGIIGELLCHIILSNELDDFKCLSILKNKEERQVKKGFDIIYYNLENIKLWYTEVKSGHKNESPNCSDANVVLLKRSRSGYANKISSIS